MKQLLLSAIITLSLQANAQTQGAGVSIDGYNYSTVIINGREWMAENLKATKYESGTAFYQPSNINQFATGTVTNYFATGPWATPYMTDTQLGTGDSYGKLYNASIIYNPNQIIKTGWHLPTKAEWQALIDYTLGENLRKVEAVSGTNYWACSGNFLDQYRFGAIAAGRVVINGSTALNQDLGTGAFFWCVSDFPAQEGQENINYVKVNCSLTTPGSNDGVMGFGLTNRRNVLSVRLIKDVALSTSDFSKSKVNVYPNPVKNILHIETDEMIRSVEIFDLLGKQIMTSTAKTINVEALQKGVYVLKINTIKGSSIEKIIKQ